MAYKVTSITTKSNISDPDFDVWYKTMLDPNVVYNKFPNLTGQSIQSIIEDDINTINDPTTGFIGQEMSANNSTYTLVTTYEHQSNVIIEPLEESCFGNILFTKNSEIVTGTNTYFTSDLEIGDTLIAKLQRSNAFIGIGKVASIESDTSLTLTAETKMPLDWDNKMDEWGHPRDYMVTTSYVK